MQLYLVATDSNQRGVDGFLDPILGLTALAVQVVVKFLGRTVEIGDYKVGIGVVGLRPLGGCGARARTTARTECLRLAKQPAELMLPSVLTVPR